MLKSKGSGGIMVTLNVAFLVRVALFAEIVIGKVPVGEDNDALIVKVDVNVVVPDVGFKVQFVEVGHPDNEREIVDAGPDVETVAVVCLPCSILPEVGLTETEKSFVTLVKNSVIA